MVGRVQGADAGRTLAKAYAENTVWEREEIAPWANSKAQFALVTFDTGLMKLADWRPIVPAIHVPTLMISGDNARGAIITPEIADEVKSLWGSELRFERIADAGHNVRRDQPSVYFGIVSAFLKEYA